MLQTVTSTKTSAKKRQPPTSRPTTPGRWRVLIGPVAGGLALLLTLLLTTWPLAAHPTGRLLGDPEIEVIEHLWTLWLGAHHGPLIIDTNLANFPAGYHWVLADPLNLAWFVPFGLISPVLGMNAVAVCNLLMAGLAAGLAGRLLRPSIPQNDPRLRVPPPPSWAVACVAMAAPTLAGNLVTGMTEAATLWAAVLALALLRPALEQGGPMLMLAALAGGAAAWGGPYTAVYAALLAPILLVAVLPATVRRVGARTAALRLVQVVLPAALIGAPVVWAITTQRPEGLPGTTSMLEQVLSSPQLQQTRYLGADLVSVLLPWLDPKIKLFQAPYLGSLAIVLALVGLARRRAWLLGAMLLWAVILGLGVYVQIGGFIPRFEGRILLLPAGLLSLVIEPLGHAARWHRMLGVGSMLLAPLAVDGAVALVARLPRKARRPALVAVIAAVLVDMIWISPVPWPRPTLDASTPPIYAALDQPGAVIAIPKQPRPVPGLPRSPNRQLLWQTDHGRPMAEKPMFQKTEPRLHALRDAIRVGALRGNQQKAQRARHGLAELGYAWIVHHDEPGNPVRADQLKAVLGQPDIQVDNGMAWRTR
ncbi:MAG: hypothetical protein GXP62_02650 [Oligoflexia bacterium]|nr:hypothetical protein [Oligoflexia bacterium]